MHAVVLGDRVLRGRRDDLGERLLEVLARHFGLSRRIASSIRPGCAGLPSLPLPRAGGDLVPGLGFPAELSEDLECEVLPVTLGHPGRWVVGAAHDHVASVSGSSSASTRELVQPAETFAARRLDMERLRTAALSLRAHSDHRLDLLLASARGACRT